MRRREPRVSAVGLSLQRIVRQRPGIHFRELGRAASLSSAGQLRHHLDRLERQGVLVEVEDGRYKRFFAAGEHEPGLRSEMARFARVVPRRIAKLLLARPMNRTQLRRSLGCADSTLGYHLSRMVQLGDLAKSRGPNCCRYSLTREETVRKMLLLEAAAEPPAPDPDGVPNALRPPPGAAGSAQDADHPTAPVPETGTAPDFTAPPPRGAGTESP